MKCGAMSIIDSAFVVGNRFFDWLSIEQSFVLWSNSYITTHDWILVFGIYEISSLSEKCNIQAMMNNIQTLMSTEIDRQDLVRVKRIGMRYEEDNLIE